MATTDTEVDLVVNEMTQEQLDELDAAGTVPPNQMFLTDEELNDNEYQNLKDMINSLSMRPSNAYSRTIITDITTANTLVFTAPANGFATIRGNFGATTAYYLKSTNGTNIFYQWATSTSSPFFAMKEGDQIYLATATTISWADIYFAKAETLT